MNTLLMSPTIKAAYDKLHVVGLYEGSLSIPKPWDPDNWDNDGPTPAEPPMPINRNEVLEILATIKANAIKSPEGSIFVMGSAAICPELAQNIDIVLRETFHFACAVDLGGFDWETPPTSLIPLKTCCIMTGKWICDPPYPFPPGSGAVRTVNLYHLLSLKAPPTPLDILGSLDISCTRFALFPDGKIIAGPGATMPFVEPPLLSPDTGTFAAMERLAKFEKRYGLLSPLF